MATVPDVTTAVDESLPGAELMTAGLCDLAAGIRSAESLLVSIGGPRLRSLGIAIPEPFDEPEDGLHELLQSRYGDAAHGRYNALVRELVSFERAAACALSRDA